VDSGSKLRKMSRPQTGSVSVPDVGHSSRCRATVWKVNALHVDNLTDRNKVPCCGKKEPRSDVDGNGGAATSRVRFVNKAECGRVEPDERMRLPQSVRRRIVLAAEEAKGAFCFVSWGDNSGAGIRNSGLAFIRRGFHRLALPPCFNADESARWNCR